MKHPKNAKRRQSRGYLLLEVVLAMGIFAMAATGFTIALHKAADASDLMSREMQITRILQSSLDEAISVPVLEEKSMTVTLDERNMEIETIYEKMEEMENQDGQLLQDMWRVTVICHYFQDNNEMARQAITWRYGRLYQP
jgi:hypothetical protein